MTFSKTNNTLLLKGLLTNLFVLGIIYLTTAQVQFKLTMLEDGETYQVSLIPERTWKHPRNITSTAQVTIKVPTNAFEVKDLTSLQLDIEWQDNSRSDSPAEAPDTDYISFGLASLGTVDFNYEAGVEMPLFQFKNALSCQGTIALMDNTEDVFMAPNSRSANVGNSITVFGARGEAYLGNVTDFSEVPCSGNFSTSIEQEEILTEELKVYPNPAINEVFVDMSWTQGTTKGALIIMDATGKEVKRKTVTLNDGFNKERIAVETLVFGIYSIDFQFDGKTLAIDRFVKGN